MTQDILEQLYQTLQDRKSADPSQSYVASLYEKGAEKICQKVIEEAGELVIEAVKGDDLRLKEETADLLFHVLVLLADKDIHPNDILSILEGRMGLSGLEEKAARKP